MIKYLVLLSTACTLWGCAAGSAGGAGAASSDDTGSAMPASADHTLLGAPAPNFSLPTQGTKDSGELSLASADGKVRLIDFWATWCQPCRLSFPKYQELQQRYGERIAIFAISEDDDNQGIAGFAAETGATFTLLWDQSKAVSAGYSVEAMPTLFIVDQNGLVRHVHSGFRAGDEDQIDAVIASLLK
jgi:thiol-disulfide isomerase/thioredoxin